MYNNEPMDDEEHEHPQGGDGLRSRWHRLMESIRGGRAEDDDAEYEEQSSPVQTTSQWARPGTAPVQETAAPRRESSSTFRVAPARRGTISVSQVQNFTDTQKVADRLKEGEPQVVNLEKTPAEVAERLIDFLNGVTYALDGYVEKVSEGAYLFTPSHIAIQSEGPEPPQPKPFFDRL
jgi:cell division inhibitor SepF